MVSPISRSYIDYSHEFIGSALARFERPPLLGHNWQRYKDRHVTIITPVECVIPLYDGYICCPKEGELHQKSRGNDHRKVWSFNIDKLKSRKTIASGLQLLWDA